MISPDGENSEDTVSAESVKKRSHGEKSEALLQVTWVGETHSFEMVSFHQGKMEGSDAEVQTKPVDDEGNLSVQVCWGHISQGKLGNENMMQVRRT